MNKQTMQLLMIGLAGAAAYLGWRFWQEKKARETAESVLANEELTDHATGQDTTVPTPPVNIKEGGWRVPEPAGAGRVAKSGGVRLWIR